MYNIRYLISNSFSSKAFFFVFNSDTAFFISSSDFPVAFRFLTRSPCSLTSSRSGARICSFSFSTLDVSGTTKYNLHFRFSVGVIMNKIIHSKDGKMKNINYFLPDLTISISLTSDFS